MSKTDEAVANPPAGGDQSQASTNDDNQNDVLSSAPFVVTIADGDSVGVVGRFADKAAADNAAKAYKVDRPQKRIEVKVVKENDITNGLPALVAEVEGAKFAEDEATTEPPRASTTTK